ncbi:MAG: hypothetical protein JWR46_1712 [Mycobacterium sp.]|jgi:hypothetical protein|nr:hypothetical protein [Mycobacterium sp.]MCW2555853.1 hypothetical protein [Mycobacterium sp.]MDT5072652.1 hypothetical protein [Mycobacterium sp.]
MTALPPDPDPAETPAVAHGVDPGDTPPDSAQTSATSNQDPPPRRRMEPTTVVAMITIGVLFVIFLTVAVVYLLQVAGVIARW